MKILIVTLLLLALIPVMVSGGRGRKPGRRGRPPHPPPPPPRWGGFNPHGHKRGCSPDMNGKAYVCKVESSESTPQTRECPSFCGREAAPCDGQNRLDGVTINDVTYDFTFCSFNYTTPPNFAEIAVERACSVQNASGIITQECKQKCRRGRGRKICQAVPCGSDNVTLDLNEKQQLLRFCLPEGDDFNLLDVFGCSKKELEDEEENEEEGSEDGEAEGEGSDGTGEVGEGSDGEGVEGEESEGGNGETTEAGESDGGSDGGGDAEAGGNQEAVIPGDY